MLYISVFPSWQATILSFPGSSNCFKCFLGRCQAWRPCFGGERKGSVRRRVFGARRNGLEIWRCYKACEMWNMGGRLWELISNTWQLFKTDQYQFSVISVTPDPATRALGSHIRRTLPGRGLQCHGGVTFVFIIYVIIEQVLDCAMWRLRGLKVEFLILLVLTEWQSCPLSKIPRACHKKEGRAIPVTLIISMLLLAIECLSVTTVEFTSDYIQSS